MLFPRSLFYFLSLLFLTSLATAQNAEQDSVKQSGQKMFDALSRGDTKSVQALWTKDAEKYPFFERMIDSYQASGTQLQFANVKFTRWEIEGENANVLLHFTRKWRDKKTGEPKSEDLIWNVRFQKQNKIWKWSWWRDAYNHVLISIIDLKTDEERSVVFQQEKELINARLVKFINDMSAIIGRRGDAKEALLYNDAALEVCKVLNDKTAQASTMMHRAGFYLYQAKYDEALQTYERLLPLFRAADDKWGEAGVLSNIGMIYQNTALYPEALKQYEDALKIAREIKDKELEGGVLGNLGNVYQARGEYAEAMTQYEASLKIKREIGDENGIVTTQNNVANVLAETGYYHEAIAQYKTSLAIAEKANNNRDKALIWGNVGNVYDSMGRYADALACHKVALTFRRLVGEKSWEAQTLNNIGLIYRETGQYNDALVQYRSSLAIASEIGDSALQAKLFNNGAMVLEDFGRTDEALEYYADSLKITRAIGDKAVESLTLNNIANIYFKQDKFAEALENYEAALAIMRAIGNRESEASALNNIGLVYFQAKRYEEALKQFRAALVIAEEIGALEAVIRAYWGMALVYQKQNQWTQAVGDYRKAVERIEILRDYSQEQSLQAGLFDRFVAPYTGLAQCLLQLGDKEGAWKVSETAKARTLVDILRSGKTQIQKSMTPTEREDEKKLSASLTSLAVQLNTAQSLNDKAEIRSLNGKINDARAAYNAFRSQLYILHSELQTKRAQFAPVQLPQLASLFEKEPQLCLLSYLVDEEETLIFALTRGENATNPVALTVQSVTVKRSELEKQIKDFRLQCATANGQKRGFLFNVPVTPPQNYRAAARALYQILLAPMEEPLKGKKQIIIMPDTILHSLPFQALLDGENRHFIEKFAIGYAPSVTALVKMQELSSQKKLDKNGSDDNKKIPTLMAMGRPNYEETLSDLPATESEVKAIGTLFGEQATLFVGKQASEDNAKTKMSKAHYLHFATHGLVNEAAPMYSSIALTQEKGDDGRLEARELLDMNLRSDMVVLSACETALGQRSDGEGVLGLTWALFVAGTPTSVVSQWSVDDTSTGRLMVEFYRNLRNGEGLSKAEALRLAQLKIMREKGYEHPFYWAPFIIVGDWN